jgi:hypothetical protein
MTKELPKPDWPEEYESFVAKLGPPLSVHHFPEEEYRRRMRRFWLWLIWSIVWPLANIVAMVGFGFGLGFQFIQMDLMFIVAAVLELRATRRNRRMRVLRYETGILTWYKNAVTSFTWEEIRSILLQFDINVKMKFVEIEAVPCLITEPNKIPRLLRLIGFGKVTQKIIKLIRNDDAEVELPNYLSEFDLLVIAIQHAIFVQTWAPIWQSYLNGEEIAFECKYPQLRGSFRTLVKVDKVLESILVSRQGISYPIFGKLHKRNFVAWSDLKAEQTFMATGYYHFIHLESVNKRTPYLVGPLAHIGNPNIFLHLLQEGLRFYREVEAKESEAGDRLRAGSS